MATVTFDKAIAGHGKATTIKPDSGFFSRFFHRLIAAREAEARRKVSQYLLNVSDSRLLDLGLSAGEIEVLRHGKPTVVDLAA